MMSLAAFWDRLNAHDWYFNMSDDRHVYDRGAKDCDEIEEIAKQSTEHNNLLAHFRAHYFTGKAWGTPEQPKPSRPEVA